MERVLVTGGAGFIGSNIVVELLDKGFDVRVLDNLSTGSSGNLSGLKGVEVINGDIRDMETVRKAVSGVDYILHQAALPSVSRSVENPLESNECNVAGSLNVLDAARKGDVKRIVYASSSSVYGDAKELPKREDMELMPLSPYAVTKIAVEHYFSVFSKVYGMRSIGLRYFNVYGPRQNPESEYAAVIPRFIKAALSGQRPVIYGDGEQTRDFTYVKDAVNANLLAMKAQGVDHEVFNVGTGKSITVNELLRKISSISGKVVEADHTDPREGDIRDSLADISKAGRILGYKPGYDMESGLKETIEWFRRD
jgi:nucleoside-diphosphate-sugar epimerase